MNPVFNKNGIQIYNADALTALRELPDESVHLICTSSPYFSLRRYEGEPQIWSGDKPLCSEHKWEVLSRTKKQRALPPEPNDGQRTKHANMDETGRGEQKSVTTETATCSECGAMQCHLGNESTSADFIRHLVEIYHECKRILHPTGLFWANISDSYAGSGGENHQGGIGSPKRQKIESQGRSQETNIVPLNLMGIPQRLALALQADGWIWRSAPTWQKLNAMPESVGGSQWVKHRIKIKTSEESKKAKEIADKDGITLTTAGLNARKDRGEMDVWEDCPGCPKCSPNDGLVLEMNAGRPTISHEYWLMFSKTDKYFFDSAAVRIPHSTATIAEIQKASKWGKKKKFTNKPNVEDYTKHEVATGRTLGNEEYADPLHTAAYHPLGRNRRTTDFFFESLDVLIKEQSEYLAHLMDIQKNGGMMLDGEGMPLALVINPQPFNGDKYLEGTEHFAVFPEKLIVPIISSSCPSQICSACGNPWIRVVEKESRSYLPSDGATVARPAYNSKYAEQDYGVPQQGFVRNNSIQEERESSRVEAEELFPDDIYAQKHYIHFIHEHGNSSKEEAVEYALSKVGLDVEEWKKSCGADSNGEYTGQAQKDYESSGAQNASDVKRRILAGMGKSKTVAWRPSCKCNAGVKRGVILDCFLGSGTSLVVAQKLGRDGIGIENSSDYTKLAIARVTKDSQSQMF